MNIFEEVKNYNCAKEELEGLKAQLHPDSRKKVGAILDILEIGQPSIAHSKLILHVCEGMLDMCSPTLGTKTDA